jgi:hypothetical protein
MLCSAAHPYLRYFKANSLALVQVKVVIIAELVKHLVLKVRTVLRSLILAF